MSQRYLGGIITANPTLPTLSSASGVWTLEQDFQNSASITPQVIGRSVRLRQSASAYFNRTSGTPTNKDVWTYSGWVKYSTGKYCPLFYALSGGFYEFFEIDNTGAFFWITRNSAGTVFKQYYTATGQRLFRDPSAWYHFVVRKTSALTLQFYVNGEEFSLTAQTLGSPSSSINTASTTHYIGYEGFGPAYADGYLTEVNFVDGQSLTPSSFGAFDSNGIWQPLSYRGTYGTNGFYLNFSDNSAATAAAIGKDYSGNGNNWTPNNISVTAGVTYDSMLDSPTNVNDGTAYGSGNYAVLNGASIGADCTLSGGNLNFAYGSSATRNSTMGTIGMPSGKWYWEMTVSASTNNGSQTIGISNQASSTAMPNYPGFNANGWGYSGDATRVNNATAVSYGATYTVGDVIGVAFDADAGSLTFYKNGTSQGVAYSGLAANTYYPAIGDGSAANTWSGSINFGQRPFTYTPPTGFKALNTQNLPAVTINNGAQYMAATLWTGTGSSQSIINSGAMQPDFTWVKSRSNAAYTHILQDSVRGVGNFLISAATSAEAANSQMVTSYNSNGFTVNVNGNVNANAETYVGWQWKESASAGFDIVTYTGNGTNGQTVNHSLGVKPAMMIVKLRSGADNWTVYHQSMGATKGIQLNQTAALQTLPGYWNNTEPTSSAFTLGTYSVANGSTFVAYLFSEVAGYSKFGSYTGNGSADGPFAYLGFRPRFVMIKRTDSTGNWQIIDTSRSTYNEAVATLYPNLSNAEDLTNTKLDALSNGFKIRGTPSTDFNTSGSTYIYAAFAENPFNVSRAR